MPDSWDATDGDYFGPTCDLQTSVIDTYDHRGVRGPSPNCDGDPLGSFAYFDRWCADRCKAKQGDFNKTKDLEGVCCPKNSDTNGDGSSGAPTYNEAPVAP